MKTFAFILSLLTIKQLKNFWPPIRIVPNFIIKSTLKNLPPFKISHLKRIQSAQGKEIEGFLIACPLLSRESSYLAENLFMEKILSAAYMAQRLGSRVIGLDGCASAIADKGQDTIARNLKIPVTSGNALNAWSVFEAIYRVTKTKNIDLKRTNLAIIGATTPVGNLCARKLSDYVAGLTIVDGQKDKLGIIKETILEINPIEVNIELDIHKAIKNADIVINAANCMDGAFDFEVGELKPNTIVCDISPFYRLFDKPNPRQDITVIRGGLIKLPRHIKLGINTGLPKGVIYASLAETMLLTFQERFVNYSFGDNINPDKLEEIADLAVQHGFEVWVPEAPVI